MHPDHEADDPFSDMEQPDSVYDDGFGEALDLGEADYASRPKRREKDRRASVRKDTGRIVMSSRRAIDHSERRHRARLAAATLARRHWKRSIQPLIPGAWERRVGFEPPAWLLAAMASAYVIAAQSVAAKKLEGTNTPEDAISVGVKALIAAAMAQGLRRTGRMKPERQQALTEQIYDGLDAGEKVLTVILKGWGSAESEDWAVADGEASDWEDLEWEDLLEAGGFAERGNGRWTNGEGGRGSQDRAAETMTDRRRAAQALRQTAKYLLRMERRLLEPGS
jgi:hypothetical protein